MDFAAGNFGKTARGFCAFYTGKTRPLLSLNACIEIDAGIVYTLLRYF